MGVKGLWKLVGPVGRPVLLETVEGKSMAIDSSIWLYQFQATMRDKDGRALVNAHILGFLRRICKLLFYGIKPVFVFDGGAPAIKKATITERKKRKSGFAASHVKLAERILAAQMRREAVAHVQAQANKDNNPVLGEDTVYLEDLDDPAFKSPSKSKGNKAVEASSPSKKKHKFHDHDPYRLPAVDIEAAVEAATRSSKPDPRLATEDELRDFIENMRPEDFDVSSPAFRELPTEVKYEIIGDLRLKSRQTSYKRLQSMLRAAPTALDFSKAQIKFLQQRNNLTQQLLTTTDSISNAHVSIPVRIASERNRQYVLMKNEGPEGGWVLGLRDDGTKDKPIEIDQYSEHESGEESSSDNMEEVTFGHQPATEPDMPDYRQHLGLSSIGVRQSPQKPIPTGSRSSSNSRASSAPRTQSKKAKKRPLFAPDDEDIILEDTDEDDPALSVAIARSLESEDVRRTLELSQYAATSPIGATQSSSRLTLASAINCMATITQHTPSRSTGIVFEDDEDEIDMYADAIAQSSQAQDQPEVSTSPVRLPSFGQPLLLRPTTTDEDTRTSTGASGSPTLLQTPKPINVASSSSARPQPSPHAFNSASIVHFAQPTPAPTASRPQQPRPREALVASHSRGKQQDSERIAAVSVAPSATSPLGGRANDLLEAATVGDAATASLSDEDDDMEEVVTVPSAPEASRTSPILAVLTGIGVGVVTVNDDDDDMEEVVPVPSAPEAGRTSAPAVLTGVGVVVATLHNNQDQDDELEDVVPISVARAASRTSPPAVPAGFSVSVATPDDDENEDMEEVPTLPASFAVSTMEQPFELEEDGIEATRTSPALPPRRPQTPQHEPTVPVHESPPSSPQTREREPAQEPEDDHWDAAQEMDMEAEESEFAQFLSQVKGRNLDAVRQEIDQELFVLNQAKKAAQRDSEDITQQMISQIMVLLRLFGIPYITAPMEAEAQCATLVELGLVEGVITDDSDVFLFGAARVFKNMFNQSKTVECFLESDLTRELGLDRDKLIRLAYLLGSDYVEGLSGVGPVVAMEILEEFPGTDGLHKFKEWWLKVQSGKDKPEDNKSAFRKRFKKKFKSLHLDDDWPNGIVRDAYYHPTVDSSDEPFKWGLPDLDALQHFLGQELGWGQDKVDDLLLPIIHRMGQRGQAASLAKQGTLSSYFDVSVGAGTYAPRKKQAYASKRLQKIVADYRKERKERTSSPQPSSSRPGSAAAEATADPAPVQGQKRKRTLGKAGVSEKASASKEKKAPGTRGKGKKRKVQDADDSGDEVRGRVSSDVVANRELRPRRVQVARSVAATSSVAGASDEESEEDDDGESAFIRRRR